MEDVAKGSRVFDPMSELELFAKRNARAFFARDFGRGEHSVDGERPRGVARRHGDWSDEQFERSKDKREK